MYSMLKCEFFKLSKSKAFLTILFCLFINGIVMSFFFLGDKEMSSTYAVYVYLTGLKDGKIFMLVMSIFAGAFIGNDFKNKTIQGSVSCGMGRISVFSSKVIVFFLAIVLIGIISPLMLFITSSIFSTSREIIPLETIKTLVFVTIACVLSNCAVASVGTVIAFCFKNSAATIGVSLGVLELGGKGLIARAIKPFPSLAEYSPFSLSKALFLRQESAGTIPLATTEDFIRVGIVAIVYTIIFLTIAYGIFRKAELK